MACVELRLVVAVWAAAAAGGGEGPEVGRANDALGLVGRVGSDGVIDSTRS